MRHVATILFFLKKFVFNFEPFFLKKIVGVAGPQEGGQPPHLAWGWFGHPQSKTLNFVCFPFCPWGGRTNPMGHEGGSAIHKAKPSIFFASHFALEGGRSGGGCGPKGVAQPP